MSLRRLMVLVYITAVAVLLLGGTSFYALNVTEKNIVEIEKHSHLVEAVADLQGMFGEVIMPGNDYLITGSPDEQAAFIELDKQLLDDFANLEKIMADHQEEKAILAEVKEEYLEVVKPYLIEILAITDPIGNTKGMQLMEEMDAKAILASEKLEKIHSMIGGENEKLIIAMERLGQIALVIVAVVGILAVILAFITARVIKVGLVNPILQLTNAANQIAEGDLTANVKVQAKAEIGELAESFTIMVDNLKNLIQQVASSAQNVAATSEELAANSGEAAKATQQVANAIQEVARGTTEQTNYISNSLEIVSQVNHAIEQISSGAQEQVKNVTNTVSLVNQMAHSITEVASGAQTVAVSAEKTRAAADKGANAVDLSIKGMDGIKTKVFESADKIQALGEHSEQIGEIIQVIDDIAEQTNLLALNAAIEAARAGEHGKGFAVVADEVRKLAERSSKATKEIAELITNIQNLTASAVTAMEQGTNEVEQGARLATDAGGALKEILSTVEETYQQVQNISAAAEEISASSQEVVKAIDNVSAITQENTAATEQVTAASSQVANSMASVSSITEETSASAEEVSASTEELTASLQEISAAADNMAGMAEILRETVAKFKI